MTTIDPVGPEMRPEKTFKLRGDGVWGILQARRVSFAWRALKEAWEGADRRINWASRHALAWRGMEFV
jgi:hypothetical protein